MNTVGGYARTEVAGMNEARHKLLKGLFLNANNLHNYFIFTLNILFSSAK